ncbi:phosphate ABC transporter permease [Halovivax asiaticus JCM 14624]|uniref:Phosphate ABC transporter permease n=1 Tax=Halovivax asiaticus JCM 14624 TaxID=1227490 RepID=M0BA37_9EURY|nr:hypothetical protein [Halovivax asiaticus]ELZ07158.1 phosphate ABC transporter permease [Halovivax asiaticus JCM 14624]
MLDPLVVAPIGIGIVLLFAGATLARYGVALMGALLGAGGGYLVAPSIAGAAGVGTPAAAAVGIALGIVVGVLVAHMLLSLAIGAIGFIVGTYFGLTALAPILVDGAWYVEIGVGVAIGAAVALAGMTLTNVTMIAITSFIGAALASQSLTFEAIAEAQSSTSVDPLLFETTEPVFLALFVVGIALQIGLLKLGYARKFVGVLPGAGGRGSRNESSTDG